MRTKTAICAGLVLAALTTAAAADPYYRQPAVIYGVGSMPSFEVITIVRSMNLNPIERPVRRGNTYVVRAATFQGDLVQVVVDARRGTVLGVSPVQTVYAPAPPGARPLPGPPWEQPQVVRPNIYSSAPPRVVTVPPYEDRSYDERPYEYDRAPSYDPPRVITAPPDPETTGSIYGANRSATTRRYVAPAPEPTPLPRPRPQVAALDVAPAAPPSPPAAAATPDPAPTAPASAPPKVIDNSPVPAAPPF